MAREDTQFKPGHKKLPGAGRAKGTPNKPLSIKAAMKQYCDENGYLVPAVLERAVAHEDPRLGLHALKLMCLYGIGLPAKQAQDTGRGSLIVQTKYPIGTDPKVMDRLLRIAADPKQSERLLAVIDRLGLDSGDQARQPQLQKRNPQKALTTAIARISQATKQPAPVLTTEDGEPLEVVGDNEMPAIYDETRRARDDE